MSRTCLTQNSEKNKTKHSCLAILTFCRYVTPTIPFIRIHFPMSHSFPTLNFTMFTHRTHSKHIVSSSNMFKTEIRKWQQNNLANNGLFQKRSTLPPWMICQKSSQEGGQILWNSRQEARSGLRNFKLEVICDQTRFFQTLKIFLCL